MGRKGKKNVKLKDVIKLVHPKEPSKLIKKILDDKLEVPYTWETELSEKGNKAEVWHKLIDSGKLPYMAMLRNINNMDKAGIDDEHWKKVMKLISDEKLVKRSRQLPFRFFSALKNTRVSDPFKLKELKMSLNLALNVSVVNLPKLKGRTFTVGDTSSSMNSKISTRSTISCMEIACLMTGMTNKFSENGIAGIFGTNLAIVPDLSGDLLTDLKTLINTQVGWATNGHLVLRYLNEQKIFCDRALIFTDEELYDRQWGCKLSIQAELNKYKKINPNFKLYIINLNGYGDSCINVHDKNVVTISGWSEKILQFISTHEESGESFIKTIENYKPK